MKLMWCWRCRAEMPMLDEEEYHQMYTLYGDCMEATNEFRQKYELPLHNLSINDRFIPMVKKYEELTGFSDIHHNAIMHHRISLFGEPCQYCGKPLRTPRAKHCASCGKFKSMMD